MGEPMGRHHFPIILSQNPKRGLKVGRDPLIFASSSTPYLKGCQSPKNGQIWPSISQNLVKGQHIPRNDDKAGQRGKINCHSKIFYRNHQRQKKDIAWWSRIIAGSEKYTVRCRHPSFHNRVQRWLKIKKKWLEDMISKWTFKTRESTWVTQWLREWKLNQN